MMRCRVDGPRGRSGILAASSPRHADVIITDLSFFSRDGARRRSRHVGERGHAYFSTGLPHYHAANNPIFSAR
jgi:hypothetical protein